MAARKPHGKGEHITVTFPLQEYKTVENAIGQEFITTWRGDDVIHISPEGTYHPLYNQREIYDKAPMKKAMYRSFDKEWVW